MGEIISVTIKTQLSFTSSDIFTTTVNYMKINQVKVCKSLPNKNKKLCGNSMKYEYYELIQNTLETTIS